MPRTTRASLKKGNKIQEDPTGQPANKKESLPRTEMKGKRNLVNRAEEAENLKSQFKDIQSTSEDGINSQNRYAEFKIDLPVKLKSYKEFVQIVGTVIEKIDKYIQSKNNCNHIEETYEELDSQEEANANSESCNLHKALHFTGAILQSALKVYQDNQTLMFKFEESSTAIKKCYSNYQILKPLLAKHNTKNLLNFKTLNQVFSMSYNKDYDPFCNFNETDILPELEKMMKECETLLKDTKEENQCGSFSQTSIGEITKGLKKPGIGCKNKENGKSPLAREDMKQIYEKAQCLLLQIKADTKKESQNLSKKSKNANIFHVFGGNLIIDDKTRADTAYHAEELKLIELLVSEYNSLSSNGLDSVLESYMSQTTKSLQISLITAILLSIVYTKQSTKLDLVNLDLLKKRINFSRIIPFLTTFASKRLVSRHYLAKALDIIASAAEESYMPRSAYYRTIKEFSFETHSIIQASLKLCKRFLEFYHSETISASTEVSLKLDLCLKQFVILNKIFESLAPSSAEADKENISPCKLRAKQVSNVEKIEALVKEAKQVPGIDNFAEFEHLLELYAQKIEDQSSVQKCLMSNEWVSPEFGLMNDSNEKEHNTLRQKELRAVMKNIVNLPARDSDHHLSRKENSSSDKKSNFDNSTAVDWLFSNSSPQFEDTQQVIDLLESEDEVQIIEVKPPGNGKSALVSRNKFCGGIRNKLDFSEEKDQLSQLKELELSGVAEEFNHKFNCLAKKPTLDEIEKKLKELRLGVSTEIFKKRKVFFEAQIKNTKDWLKLYEQKVVNEKKSIAEVQALVNQISDNDLRVPEMEQLLQIQREFALWKTKFSTALRKIDKKKNLTLNSQSKEAEALTLIELQEVVLGASKLKICEHFKEVGLQDLQTIWNQIESLKLTLASGQNDLNTLKKVLAELRALKIYCPEFEDDLREKIEFNEEIKRYIEEKIPIEKLESLVEELDDRLFTLDSSLYSQMKRRIKEARELQQRFIALGMPRKIYQGEQLKEIRSLVSNLEDMKVEISGLQELKNVIATFSWLLELTNVIKSPNLGVNHRNKRSHWNESIDGPELDLNTLEKNHVIEEVIDSCRRGLSSLTNSKSIPQEFKIELRRVLNQGENLELADQRIQELFYELRLQVTQFDVVTLANQKDPRISEELPETLNTTQINQDPGDEAAEMKDWNNLYANTVSTDIEDFLRDKSETFLDNPELRNCIMHLRSNFQKLLNEENIPLINHHEHSSKVSSLRKYLGWIEWLLRAKDCTSHLDLNDNDRLMKLQKLFTEAPELEIPKSWETYSKVVDLFTLADSALADYKQKFQYANSYEKWTQAKSPQKREPLFNFIAKNKAKPSFSEAKTLRELLTNKLHYINCKKEIGDLDQKITSYISWKTKMQLCVKSDGQRIQRCALDSSSTIKDISRIESQIELLQTEYSGLSLRDEEDENVLLGLESQLRAYKIGKNLGRSLSGEEWKNLLKYVEKNPKIDPSNDARLVNALKNEKDSLRWQHQCVKDLQNAMLNGLKTELTLEDLHKIRKNFEKGLISAEEDENFIAELAQKAERLVEREKELCSSEKKEPIIEFTKTLDQMRHLPINFPAEEKELEEVISTANQIAGSIRKQLQMDIHTVNKILKEYQKCPVLISEAEKFHEKYRSSKKLYELLKTRIKSILQDKEQLNYDQLTEIADQLEDVGFDFEGDLTAMKVHIYSLRVQFLKKSAESFTAAAATKPRGSSCDEQKESFTICSQVIKLLAREGRELSESLKNQPKSNSVLNQAIASIDGLLQKIEEKIKEISSVTSLEAFDKLPQTLFGFIDLSQNFIERKVTISNALLVCQNQTLGHCQKKALADIGLLKSIDSNIQKPSIQKISCQKDQQTADGKTILLERSSPVRSEEKSHNDSKNNKISTQTPSPSISRTNSPTKLKKNLTLNDHAESSSAVITIGTTLRSCRSLCLNQSELLKISQKIAQAFPLIQRSTEKLNKFVGILKQILKYPDICAFLAQNSFEPKEISKLLQKSPRELLQLDKKLSLNGKFKVDKKKDADSVERLEGSIMNRKKLKSELNSPVVNIADRSSNLINELPRLDTSKDPRMKNLLRAPPSPAITNFQTTKYNTKQTDKLLQPNYSNKVSNHKLASHKYKAPSEGSGFQKNLSRVGADKQQDNQSICSEISQQNYENEGLNLNIHSKSDHLCDNTAFLKEAELTVPQNQKNIVKLNSKESATGQKASNLSQDVNDLQANEINVLKVFEGKLKGIGDNAVPSVKFLTCDPIQNARNFPKIPVEGNNLLRIQGRLSFSRFEPYLSKVLSTFDSNKECIMSGWIVPASGTDKPVVAKIAAQFLNDSKVGIFKYFECAKIFFMDKSQLLSEWACWLKFKTENLEQNSCSNLCFIMMFQPSKLPSALSVLKTIEPEVVKSCPKKKKNLNKDQNNEKPLTYLEEDFAKNQTESRGFLRELSLKESFTDFNGRSISPIKNLRSDSHSPKSSINSKDIIEPEESGKENSMKEPLQRNYKFGSRAQLVVKDSSPFKTCKARGLAQNSIKNLNKNENSLSRKPSPMTNNSELALNKINLEKPVNCGTRAHRNSANINQNCNYCDCKNCLPSMSKSTVSSKTLHPIKNCKDSQFNRHNRQSLQYVKDANLSPFYKGNHNIISNHSTPKNTYNNSFYAAQYLPQTSKSQPNNPKKPNAYDPAINPLYQSYLNKKIFEKSSQNQFQAQTRQKNLRNRTANSEDTFKQNAYDQREPVNMMVYIRGISNQYRQRNGFKQKTSKY